MKTYPLPTLLEFLACCGRQCFCAAQPKRLQTPGEAGGFSDEFKRALHAVYAMRGKGDETKRFLACTTKVGWRAESQLVAG